MKDSDKNKFANLMTTLGVLHNRKLSPELITIYWHALKCYEFSEIQACMSSLIRDPDIGQFMPKPADVVAYIEGKSGTKSLRAWTKVLWAMRYIGAWDSVEFDDPKIHAVILEMGGWINLCKCTSKELPFIAKEFERLYAMELIHGKQEYPTRLAGRLEQTGGCYNGNSINEIRYVGDKTIKNTIIKLENKNI